MVHEIENFYGCYLLYSKNPRYKGHTYIGFTVDPNRRIKQHNAGKKAGGAWKTSGRGPWEMVLIIHGFPNEISALRFEWAWQHPGKSRRLKHITAKKKSEQGYGYKFRVASEMLRAGPWDKLPLTIRWLNQDYCLDFEPNLQPAEHMSIAYGPVKSIKLKNQGYEERKRLDFETDGDDELPKLTQEKCSVCKIQIKQEDECLQCLHPSCHVRSHVICLSKHYIKKAGVAGQILPIQGTCPKCNQSSLWGDLIRYKRGCYSKHPQSEGSSHWTDTLVQT